MPENKALIPRFVGSVIDRSTGRALVKISRKLDIKNAAVVRAGLKAVIPGLLKEAGK